MLLSVASAENVAATDPRAVAFLGRGRRSMTRLAQGLSALFLGLHLGGGWYFSNQIRSGALEPVPPPDPNYRFKVLAVDDGTITLSTDTTGADSLGLHGVVWPDGHGVVDQIVDSDDSSVVRKFEAVSGVLSPGALVDLDVFVYSGDPLTSLGLAFDTVSFPGPLGPLSAWHVPGAGSSWVIFVHGKSGPLNEALRTVRALHDAGMHVLVASYRNDIGMPVDPSGYYQQGLTEWEDLAASVVYAQKRGAADVAIIGSSMGGAIVTSFLRESPLALDVAAVVLDAPMLDFGAAIAHQANSISVGGLGVPQSLLIAATKLTSWRFGVDWDRLDYTRQAERYATPMLIFHGTEDDSVPIGPSRRLAKLRPDLVELVETQGAGHVSSWNIGPEAYESRVVEFLSASFDQ